MDNPAHNYVHKYLLGMIQLQFIIFEQAEVSWATLLSSDSILPLHIAGTSTAVENIDFPLA
jgi:hypothetical protein